MKTPREILLAKHQAAETKLDQIRRGVVQQMRRAPQSGFVDRVVGLWRDLILSQPQRWAGMAGLWLVICLLKFSTPDNRTITARQSHRSPEVTAELKEQRAFFGELAGLPAPEVRLSKPLPSRPRSSRNPGFHRA